MNLKLPSQSFQPRLAPAVTGLISSTMFWPMSATNMLPFFGIPGEALGVAHAVGVDLAERVGVAVVDERVAGGNAVLAVGAVRAERIDAQDLAERRIEVLRQVERVAAAAAVGEAHVEQAEIGAAGATRAG